MILALTPAIAQEVEQHLWSTNGNITGIVRSGGKIYVCGAFVQAGPNTGCAISIDRRTGKVLPDFPRVAGVVNAAIADGAGGWYLGGALKGVGGLDRPGVAHVLAGGKVSDWNPGCDGRVLALALRGSTLYVAGEFTTIGGEPRVNLAALDVNSGRATEWNPVVDGTVRVLLLADTTIYVGGHYNVIADSARLALAEIGCASGRATAWNPGPSFSGRPGSVMTLAAQHDTIYIGGAFGSLGGQYRLLAGSVSAITGIATDWNPWPEGFPDNRYDPSDIVSSIVPAGPTVYVAGAYATIGGQPRNGLAEVDALTGRATSWNPRTALDPGFVNFNVAGFAIAVTEHSVFASGTWSYVGDGLFQNAIAEFDRTTGLSTGWDPRGEGLVDVLAVSGDVLFAGGRFSTFGWQPRYNLAAFDAATGMLTDWDPRPGPASPIVYDLVVHDGKVYVGGYFREVGGQIRGGIAALDTLTGAALDWAPQANSAIQRFKIANGRLYAVGSFTAISGIPRSQAASFDLATGELTDWNPWVASAGGPVHDISIQDNIAYLAGSFRQVGGIDRKSLAAVDAETGQLLDWNPSAESSVQAIVLRDTVLFAGGVFRAMGGQPRGRLAAIDARTGATLDWVADAWHSNPNFPRVFSLEVAGDTLFVGGNFHKLGGEPRGGLAALDAATARVLPWDPAPGSASPDYPLGTGVIWELTGYENTLYVGGRFLYMGRTPVNALAAVSMRPKVAPWPRPSPFPTDLATVFPNPVRAAGRIGFSLLRASRVTLGLFDLQGRRVASVVPGELMPPGDYELPFSAEDWREGFYFCRLEVDDKVSTRKVLVLKQ